MNVAQDIIRAPILPFRMASAYLVRGPGGVIVVDTGVAGSHGRILAALARHDLAPRDVRLIVITHAHTDHAGGAAALQAATGAPVAAHAAELRHLRGLDKMELCPTGFWGRLFYKTPLPHEPYAPVEPAVVLDGQRPLDLRAYGVNGQLVATPGHSAGSLSVLLDGGDALVGDLVAGGIMIGGVMRVGRAIRPPFDEDQAEAGRSLAALVDGGFERFHLGHGGPIDAAEARRHLEHLRLAAA